MYILSGHILQGCRIVQRNPRFIHNTCSRLAGPVFDEITKKNTLDKDEIKRIDDEVKEETKV